MQCAIRLIVMICCTLASLAAGPAEARRVALVIGNGAYAHVPQLPNPTEDATAIGAALELLGFDKVVVRHNLAAEALRGELLAFEAHANGSDLAVVYYAGHGIEVDGQNYLIPIDARLARSAAIEVEAISLSTVTGMLTGARKLRLVILDACRSNPFRARLASQTSPLKRAIGRGLGRVEPGDNELIAFAAAPGTEAEDGAGKHSPFTAALLKHIQTPGLEVRFLFAEVRDDVLASTSRQQQPHVYGSLGRERIYLRPAAVAVPEPPVPPPAVAAAAAPSAPVATDAEAWRGWRLRGPAGHTDAVLALAVTHDGRTIVSGGKDETVRLWEAASGRLLHTLEGHTGQVNAVAVTPDGRTIVSGANRDESVWLREATSGRLLRRLVGHRRGVNAVVVTPDGGTIVSADEKEVKLWETASARLLHTLEERWWGTKALAVTPDGQRIVSVDRSDVTLWDAASGRLLHTLQGHTAEVNAVAVTPDGQRIASGGADKTVRLWDSASGRLLHTNEGDAEAVLALAVTPDGRTIVSGGKDKTVRLWEAASGRLLRRLEGHAAQVNALAVTPDGRTIVSASSDKTVRLWDFASGRLLRTNEGDTTAVKAVAVTPDGRTIVSASWDNSIRLWEAASGRLLRTLEGDTKQVYYAVTPDGRTILSSDVTDLKISRWDVTSGRKLPPRTGDKALFDRAWSASRASGRVTTSSSTLTLRGADGMPRADLTVLPDGHWVSITADGLTYTGSTGVEKYLFLVKDFETRNVPDDFKRRYFRAEGLALGK